MRLQAVVACTYVARPEAMEVAAIAADFPTDKFLTYALNQAVFALKPYWLAPFKAGKLNLENKPVPSRAARARRWHAGHAQRPARTGECSVVKRHRA